MLSLHLLLWHDTVTCYKEVLFNTQIKNTLRCYRQTGHLWAFSPNVIDHATTQEWQNTWSLLQSRQSLAMRKLQQTPNSFWINFRHRQKFSQSN